MKKLIKVTPKKYLEDTLNLLLICVGARSAYYNDFDINIEGNMSIQAMPKAYRDAFLNVCNIFNFSIIFDTQDNSRRWMVLNPSKGKGFPTSSKETGEWLGFPCSSNTITKNGVCTKKSISASLFIQTEHGDTHITGFICSIKQLSAIEKWFLVFKQSSTSLKGFFRIFIPRLELTQYECKGETIKQVWNKSIT